MENISLRRGLAGFFTIVTGVCGIFLFTMINANEMDFETAKVIGYTGAFASLGVALSEFYSVSKAQYRRIEDSEDVHTEDDEGEEEAVKECSWIFPIVSFFLTSFTQLSA